MRTTTAIVLALWAIGWHTNACAYRPFNGTDASVAGSGEMELELGPVGFLREGPQRTLIAPAWTLNYGVRPCWQVVIKGQGTHGLSAGNNGSRLYLAVVLDLCARKVVGWAMAPDMQAMLVCRALQLAAAQRRPARRLIAHSDRGSQYASTAHQALLTKNGLMGSMSRKGNCWAWCLT